MTEALLAYKAPLPGVPPDRRKTSHWVLHILAGLCIVIGIYSVVQVGLIGWLAGRTTNLVSSAMPRCAEQQMEASNGSRDLPLLPALSCGFCCTGAVADPGETTIHVHGPPGWLAVSLRCSRPAAHAKVSGPTADRSPQVFGSLDLWCFSCGIGGTESCCTASICRSAAESARPAGHADGLAGEGHVGAARVGAVGRGDYPSHHAGTYPKQNCNYASSDQTA
jgi:hypothetical protein